MFSFARILESNFEMRRRHLTQTQIILYLGVLGSVLFCLVIIPFLRDVTTNFNKPIKTSHYFNDTECNSPCVTRGSNRTRSNFTQIQLVYQKGTMMQTPCDCNGIQNCSFSRKVLEEGFTSADKAANLIIFAAYLDYRENNLLRIVAGQHRQWNRTSGKKLDYLCRVYFRDPRVVSISEKFLIANSTRHLCQGWNQQVIHAQLQVSNTTQLYAYRSLIRLHPKSFLHPHRRTIFSFYLMILLH